MPIRKQALDTTFSRHQICAVEKTAIKRPLETEGIPPLIDDPRKALEVFGHAAWHDFREYRMPVIPVAGFLCLWLIGAWTDGFKKVR